MSLNDIIEQLYDIYINHEPWHTSRISKESFFKYTEKLIGQGNIFCVFDGSKVVGYMEVWKLNYSQFGRLVCGENVAGSDEDVLSGNLGFVANTWVDPEYRKSFGCMGGAIEMLRKMYFDFTRGVDYHCGQAKRKHAQLVKVFRAEKLKGAKYGQHSN